MKRLVAALLAAAVWGAMSACATAQTASATQTQAGAEAGHARPEHAHGIVVLTYDDALSSQLTNAVPALDAAGLKGVFFLTAIKDADRAAWRRVGLEGHELANHTIFHPCLAATVPADPAHTLEAYTPEKILAEIAQQNAALTALDGRTHHGFATPCGQSVAGGHDYLEPLRASGLVDYVRGVSVTPEDLRTDIRSIDRIHLPARGFDASATGADLIAFAEQAMRGGGTAVFLFHGVGGDYLSVDLEAHKALLAWLAAHREQVWTTTLEDAFAWADANPR